MPLKKNIFDRLSLKKKINLSRQNKISEQLSSESKKNANLIEQIKDLQSQRVADNSTPVSYTHLTLPTTEYV